MASRISNFRAYFHRKYTINGKDYDEGEREMAQLPNTRDSREPDDINLYQGFISQESLCVGYTSYNNVTNVTLPRPFGPRLYM